MSYDHEHAFEQFKNGLKELGSLINDAVERHQDLIGKEYPFSYADESKFKFIMEECTRVRGFPTKVVDSRYRCCDYAYASECVDNLCSTVKSYLRSSAKGLNHSSLKET